MSHPGVTDGCQTYTSQGVIHGRVKTAGYQDNFRLKGCYLGEQEVMARVDIV